MQSQTCLSLSLKGIGPDLAFMKGINVEKFKFIPIIHSQESNPWERLYHKTHTTFFSSASSFRDSLLIFGWKPQATLGTSRDLLNRISPCYSSTLKYLAPYSPKASQSIPIIS